MEEIKYLLVINYYSCNIEIVRLSTATSSDVIIHIKSLFACHVVPETLTSENLYQKYGFTHITSSPQYAQGNGFAEWAMRTIKSLFAKIIHM